MKGFFIRISQGALEVKVFSDRVEWYNKSGQIVAMFPQFCKRSEWVPFLEKMFNAIYSHVTDEFPKRFYLVQFFSWRWFKYDLRFIPRFIGRDKKPLQLDDLTYINELKGRGLDVSGWVEGVKRYYRNFRE